MNAISSGIRPAMPTAAKLTQGVSGANIHEVGAGLARDSATLLDSLDRTEKTDLVGDVGKLKVQLGARLGEQAMGHALMTAGALLGGPHGVVLSSLQGNLKATLASPQKLDALAANVAKFGERGPQESAPTRGDVYSSLNTQVTGGLIREKVEGKNVPTGSFLAGAFANAYQDQGGYMIAG